MIDLSRLNGLASGSFLAMGFSSYGFYDNELDKVIKRNSNVFFSINLKRIILSDARR